MCSAAADQPRVVRQVLSLFLVSRLWQISAHVGYWTLHCWTLAGNKDFISLTFSHLCSLNHLSRFYFQWGRPDWALFRIVCWLDEHLMGLPGVGNHQGIFRLGQLYHFKLNQMNSKQPHYSQPVWTRLSVAHLKYCTNSPTNLNKMSNICKVLIIKAGLCSVYIFSIVPFVWAGRNTRLGTDWDDTYCRN